MGQINIYRIASHKRQDCLVRLNRDFIIPAPPKTIYREDSTTYTLTFYYLKELPAKDVSWAWVFRTYAIPLPEVKGSPKGIITISINDDLPVYAVTFGTAFFIIDQYCDRDFGFEYASRVPYRDIKLTALTNPTSIRNKTINSFRNNHHLDFDSGESFSKIKGKIDLEEDSLKNTIEVGTAIKFQVKEDSLEAIVDLILHIETVLQQSKQTSIPVFKLVKEEEKITTLNNHLVTAIQNNSSQVLVSEFNIIGSMEVFNRSDSYVIKYKQLEKETSELSLEVIKAFCEKHGIPLSREVFEIKITSFVDGRSQNTSSFYSMLDYMDESERCLLINGSWYEFNDDYLNYLMHSLSEIPVIYNPDFDFTSKILSDFQKNKAQEEKILPEYQGKTLSEVEKSMRTKYYAERAFNMLRSDNNGFKLYDRGTNRIGNAKIEIMDLFSNTTMFAVKRGNSSGDFSYVTDQSLMSVQAYKENLIQGAPSISKVAVWLIFERSEKIPLKNNTLDWDALNMLILKNKLDSWKKAVRLAGFQPEIWINYQTKD